MTPTIRRFVNEFDRLIQREIIAVSVKLSKGQCRSMEDYRREVGKCEGMQRAVEVAREMMRQMELAEDGDEGAEGSSVGSI